MMPLRRFTLHQPQRVSEAAEMLAHYGENGRLYAGGTELLLAMKHDLLHYEHLVDLKTVPGLNEIRLEDSRLTIGATATHGMIERSPLVRQHLPVMAAMAAQVANVRVRATGTLGGNVCFAEPHSDPATLLLGLEARARVQGRQGERTLPIADVIVGAYETALAPDEILIAFDIPLPPRSQRAVYLKFQIYERPTLAVALVLDLDEGDHVIQKARAVIGCVGARPSRSADADALLLGPKERVERQLTDAGRSLGDAAGPVDDLEGSADYKRHLIGVFLRRAFARAFSPRPG
jgi:aerobic carbon-monoxide dehydrogenase medium subunit